jgi:hypothetical protein
LIVNTIGKKENVFSINYLKEKKKNENEQQQQQKTKRNEKQQRNSARAKKKAPKIESKIASF